MSNTIEQNGTFSWPNGQRAALSLTFDDARLSQADCGLPILDELSVRATFYVSLPQLQQRLDVWRNAIGKGHEIGNHTLNHPCSGNFVWSRDNALEDYTLERMEDEFRGANQAIRQFLDVTPTTFAYPCGQKFVGRGRQLQSYVPVVARNFLAGRGFRDESVNDPAYCDLAQLHCIDGDSTPLAAMQAWIDDAVELGGWLIFGMHDVGKFGRQAVDDEVLAALCRYAQEPERGVWVDTVAAIAAHVHQSRQSG